MSCMHTTAFLSLSLPVYSSVYTSNTRKRTRISSISLCIMQHDDENSRCSFFFFRFRCRRFLRFSSTRGNWFKWAYYTKTNTAIVWLQKQQQRRWWWGKTWGVAKEVLTIFPRHFIAAAIARKRKKEKVDLAFSLCFHTLLCYHKRGEKAKK